MTEAPAELTKPVSHNVAAAPNRVKEIGNYFPSILDDFPEGSEINEREAAMLSNMHRIMYHSDAHFRWRCSCAERGFKGGGVGR